MALLLRQRGWVIEAGADDSVIEAVAVARRRRILHYQAKTQRQCSAFFSFREGSRRTLVNRHWLGLRTTAATHSGSAALLEWLNELPAQFSELPVIKAGNTATLATAVWEDQELVIKRYNNKSAWHRLRRLLRRDRGLNSWIYGHTLDFVGIPTATPIALQRSRLAGPTYLVMTAAKGAELTAKHCENEAVLFDSCAQMLSALGAEGIVHGDMKASNLLVMPAALPRTPGRICVIDLDAMRMPRWRRARRSGEIRDKRRFLRNFASAPGAQQRFRSILGL